MKIVVTGFEPFGGEKINPSYEAVKKLDDNIAGAEIIKIKVPTVFGESVKTVVEKIKKEKPTAVLSIGQAGGRAAVCVERVAININDANIPDNKNQKPVDTPIDINGKNAYFATIPVKRIIASINKLNINAKISNSAGTYVCNNLMYGVLNYIYKNELNIKAGFLHIPYLPEQTADKPDKPSMSLNNIKTAIKTAIEVIAKEQR